MSILRKHNKQELNALQEVAVASYKNRQHGYDAHAETDPKTCRPIGKVLVGAYISELVLTPAQIIPVYLAKIEEGYTLHELGTLPFAGTSHHIYFYKPQAEQEADIKVIHAAVEAEYRREIDESNRLTVDRQVELELAAAQRRAAEVQASELKTQRAEMAERIRAELSR